MNEIAVLTLRSFRKQNCKQEGGKCIGPKASMGLVCSKRREKAM